MVKALLTKVMVAVCLLVAVQGWAAGSEVKLQPGPGANDGRDDGSQDAGKDTYTYGATPQDRAGNQGNASTVLSQPTSNCNTAMARAFIRFNVDSLPADVQAVYLGVTHLAHTDRCFSNCSADFYFYPVLGPWNEMTLTYDKSPKVGKAIHGPIRIKFPNDLGAKEYDITDIYRKWKRGAVPNQGLAIFSPTEGCNNCAVYFGFCSSDEQDASKRPYLRIVTKEKTAEPVTTEQESETMIQENVTIQETSVTAVQDHPTSFDASDALKALKMSTRSIPESPSHDADRDGQVTSSDARMILQKAVNK
jgi:hypothetical protein